MKRDLDLIVPDPATGVALRLHFDPGPSQKAAEDDCPARWRAYFDNQPMPAMGPM